LSFAEPGGGPGGFETADEGLEAPNRILDLVGERGRGGCGGWKIGGAGLAAAGRLVRQCPMIPDPAVERRRLLQGFDPQFPAEQVLVRAELPQRGGPVAHAQVAGHELPMHVLPQGIRPKEFAPHRDGGEPLAAGPVVSQEALQRSEMREPEPFPIQEAPVLVESVKEMPLVER
jgi:hypothetical protein